MALITYISLAFIAALAAFVVYPNISPGDVALMTRIAQAITHRKPLTPPADLHYLFDGPTPWPGTTSRIVGTLAAHGIIAHEVERSALPDYVPNIRGSALFLMVETATPYFAVLSTGSPQLAYYDEQAH